MYVCILVDLSWVEWRVTQHPRRTTNTVQVSQRQVMSCYLVEWNGVIVIVSVTHASIPWRDVMPWLTNCTALRVKSDKIMSFMSVMFDCGEMWIQDATSHNTHYMTCHVIHCRRWTRWMNGWIEQATSSNSVYCPIIWDPILTRHIHYLIVRTVCTWHGMEPQVGRISTYMDKLMIDSR
jgi:hypothetical protein